MILAVEEGQYYLHEHTVYNHSFEAELAELLAVVQHTGVVQKGIVVALLEHLSLAPGEINFELMVTRVLGETVVTVEETEAEERVLHGAEELAVRLQ